MLVHVTTIAANLGVDSPIQLVSGPVFASLKDAESWVYDTISGETDSIEFRTADDGSRLLVLSEDREGGITEDLIVGTVRTHGVIPASRPATVYVKDPSPHGSPELSDICACSPCVANRSKIGASSYA